MRYTSPNGRTLRDILGTWLLSGLSGHRRYAQATALRGDAVGAQVLGCERIVGEDTLRRALKAMDAEAAERWLQAQLLRSVRYLGCCGCPTGSSRTSARRWCAGTAA